MNLCCRRTEAPAVWSKRLIDEKIVGGIELARWYPELEQCDAVVRDGSDDARAD